MIALSFSFFVTAILYAAVGFGGGSTYSALLVLVETDYLLLPSLALICNLIVVTGGVYRFLRAGHVDFKRIWPWVVTSVPAAWLGGYVQVSEVLFTGLLGFSLLAAGLRMLWRGKNAAALGESCMADCRLLPPLVGGALGFFAGVVGIGGGIFLAPVLYLLRWDDARRIAATCSIFIFVNSLAGLFGQFMKPGSLERVSELSAYGALFLAVLVGGQIGAALGAFRLNPCVLRFLTACLILYVAVRLIVRWGSLV